MSEVATNKRTIFYNAVHVDDFIKCITGNTVQQNLTICIDYILENLLWIIKSQLVKVMPYGEKIGLGKPKRHETLSYIN